MTLWGGLSHAAKVRLVTVLAQFSGPTEAARVVSEEFGVTLTRAQAWKYDPTRSGCNISPRLWQLFAEIRQRWLNDISTIAIAHQAHRLRVLDRLARKLEAQGDYVGAMKALEQAAREIGGCYSNVRRAVVSQSVDVTIRGPDEMRAELALRLAALADDAERSQPVHLLAAPAADEGPEVTPATEIR